MALYLSRVALVDGRYTDRLLSDLRRTHKLVCAAIRAGNRLDFRLTAAPERARRATRP